MDKSTTTPRKDPPHHDHRRGGVTMSNDVNSIAPTTDEDVHVAGSRASLGSLVEQVRDGGSRCQVDRVVIAPCDEYGSTDTELGLYVERDHFYEVANTFRTKFNEADARAKAAEARVAELEAMTPAPSTPREALALAVDLAYEVEGETLPDQSGYMTVREGGMIHAYPDESPVDLPVRGDGYRRLLLDPPAPVTPARPEGAERYESLILDQMGGDIDPAAARALADRIAREVEA